MSLVTTCWPNGYPGGTYPGSPVEGSADARNWYATLILFLTPKHDRFRRIRLP